MAMADNIYNFPVPENLDKLRNDLQLREDLISI